MSGFVDIHSHFVYGIDDGPRSRAGMEAMLDAAYDDGITALYATPHVTPGLRPFDGDVFQRHLDEARQYCQSCDYPITLYAGAELLCTPALWYASLQNLPNTPSDSGAILVEFVPNVAYSQMEGMVSRLQQEGYAVLLAHVERYDCLLHGKNAWKFKEKYGVRYQVNASTIIDGLGFFKNRRIRRWFDERLIDHIASDAHSCRRRTYRMTEGYAALKSFCPQSYANRLVGR